MSEQFPQSNTNNEAQEDNFYGHVANKADDLASWLHERSQAKEVDDAHTEALKEYRDRDYDGYIDHTSSLADDGNKWAGRELRKEHFQADMADAKERGRETLENGKEAFLAAKSKIGEMAVSQGALLKGGTEHLIDRTIDKVGDMKASGKETLENMKTSFTDRLDAVKQRHAERKEARQSTREAAREAKAEAQAKAEREAEERRLEKEAAARERAQELADAAQARKAEREARKQARSEKRDAFFGKLKGFGRKALHTAGETGLTVLGVGVYLTSKAAEQAARAGKYVGDRASEYGDMVTTNVKSIGNEVSSGLDRAQYAYESARDAWKNGRPETEADSDDENELKNAA